MTRARVTFTIDDSDKIIFARYIGELEASDAIESSIDQISGIDSPWEYDHIFDLRRFDGVMLSSEIQAMGVLWKQLANTRDAGRLSAIISSDPLIHARISITRESFPGRIMEVFSHIDEGLDWINVQRGYRTIHRAV